MISSSGIKKPLFDTHYEIVQAVMEMIIEESILGTSLNRFDDHESICSRIKGCFAYVNEQDGCWHPVTAFMDPTCLINSITLRYTYSKKLARQTLQLSYPFTLTKGILYLWGLIAGSTVQTRNTGITLDASQEPIVRAFANELGLTLKILPVSRSRQRYGAEQMSLSRYRKIKVTFPSVFRKFLMCLGYIPEDPCIPNWLSAEQRAHWVEGYLNSSKLQCQIQHMNSIRPKLTIYVPSAVLSEAIAEVLDHVGIRYSLYQWEGRIQLIIQRRASLEGLTHKFDIKRPKLEALVALLQHIDTDSALRLYIRKLKLTEFQLTLYGVTLNSDARPEVETEYTLFEKTFAVSSNTIRQNLYHLDKMGLVTYFEKENHKEFLTQSNRYLAYLEDFLRAEEEELKSQLKYTESNALSFHCNGCNKIVGYADAIGDHSFECPDCHSRDLHPLETSRYFGHLGALTHYQKALAGATG